MSLKKVILPIFRQGTFIAYTGLMIFFYGKAEAQNRNEQAHTYELFFKAYEVYNPAASGAHDLWEISLAYKNQIGLFNGFRSFFSRASLILNGATDTSYYKHVAGFQFMGNNEGDYISKNRVQAYYNFHIRISRRYHLSAGATTSYISYGFRSNTASAGGADNKFAVSGGLMLYNHKFKTGLSAMDVNAPQLTPISQTFTLNRYYNFIIERKFQLGAEVSTIQCGLVQWLGRDEYIVNYASLFEYRNFYTLGFFYRYQRGAGLMAGINNLKISQVNFNVLLSYKLPLSNLTRLDLNTFEVISSFSFPGKSVR